MKFQIVLQSFYEGQNLEFINQLQSTYGFFKY